MVIKGMLKRTMFVTGMSALQSVGFVCSHLDAYGGCCMFQCELNWLCEMIHNSMYKMAINEHTTRTAWKSEEIPWSCSFSQETYFHCFTVQFIIPISESLYMLKCLAHDSDLVESCSY